MKRKEKGRREEREKRRKFDPIHNYDQKGDVAKTTQLHHTRTQKRAKRSEQDPP